MKVYMHTVNGRPAGFSYIGDSGSGQICFASKTSSLPLCLSLSQIRKDERLTRKFRLGMGFDFNPKDYSYIVMNVPEMVKKR